MRMRGGGGGEENLMYEAFSFFSSQTPKECASKPHASAAAMHAGSPQDEATSLAVVNNHNAS